MDFGTQMINVPAGIVGAEYSTNTKAGFNFETIVDVDVDDKAVASPVCVQSGDSFYLNVGGDPTKKSGWSGPLQDRCCRASNGNCRWWTNLEDCQNFAGSDTESCHACSSDYEDLACPNWEDEFNGMLYELSSMQEATPLLMGNVVGGQQVPIAIQHAVGDGKVVTVLLDKADAIDEFHVMQYLVTKFTDPITPFFILDDDNRDDNIDVRDEVLVTFGRTPGGAWIVGLINTNGVSKQPGTAESINSSEAKTVRLQTKAGEIRSAEGLKGILGLLEVGADGVRVSVPAGGATIVKIVVT